MITDFDEGPVRFESVHSMSLPYPSPLTTFLRVSLFAKVTAMHLDKLLSWDDMRDSAAKPKQKRRTARLPESEFFSEDNHDIFSRVQIHEISEDGTYQPVEVIQANAMDSGAYQLHQGLQRRIVVNLTHTSGETLQWQDVTSMRVGRIRLLDASGNAPSLDSPVKEVPVKLVAKPAVRNNADGTTNVTFIGQWDSSMHSSLLLDRATPDKYRIQASLLFNVTSSKLAEPMVFSLDLQMQIRGRTYIRQTSMFMQLWNSTRVVHSTVGIFSVAIRPTSVKRATDLWRMNTRDDYIKGEEALSGWTPRGVSLIRDFISTQKRRNRISEIETARSVLSSRALTTFPAQTSISTLDERQSKLLERVIALWKTKKAPAEIILNPTNLEPPTNGAAFAPQPVSPSPEAVPPPSLIATVRYVSKNPTLMKGGYLLTPDPSNSKWIRRYVELRKPYLHIHSVPEGDELNAINLSNSRVDHSPQIARLLTNGAAHVGSGRLADTVFAVFARSNTYLFRARSEREKIEWILRIDQSYFNSSGSDDGDEQ
jgi:kinesin family protein 1